MRLPLALLAVFASCTPTPNPDEVIDELVWHAPDRAYRLGLELSGVADLSAVVVEADVDFRAALDGLGDDSPFDPASLWAVATVGSEQVVLRSQFVDSAVGILEKSPSDDPTGDDYGAVILLTEGLDGVNATHVDLYFDSRLTAPSGRDDSLAADVLASTTRMETGGTVVDFDPARGGMLASLSWEGSPSLTSIADSAYGNSIATKSPPNTWQIDPQDAPGSLEILAEGPLVAGLRASGLRGDDQGAYAYDHEYWMFAGRPEVYGKVHQVTTRDTLVEHPDDATQGMRPLEARHQVLGDLGIVDRGTSEDGLRGWLRSEEWGVGYAFVRPPRYAVRTINELTDEPLRYFFAFVANDWQPEGVGVPARVPALTTYFDHDVFVIRPFAGGDPDPDAALSALAVRPWVVVSQAEARP